MKKRIIPLFACLLATSICVHAQPELTADSILSISKHVAAYRTGYARDWIYSTCCTGVMAMYQATSDTSYLSKMINWGQAGNWLPADGNPFTTNADMQCCCQTYCEDFLARPLAANVKYYQTWKSDWDSIMYKMMPQGRVLWSWEDALFMCPPAVSMLGAITQDQRYYDTLCSYWWDVAAMLYDTTYHLYYRDASKVNGTYNNVPVFWSRGCGWVAAGMARVLKYMPQDYSGRPALEKQFQDLCTAILACQGSDGLWRSNLLSPSQYPDPEMSGTCFYCYAFAWGVNNGILDKTIFGAAAKKAWSGMIKYVNPDGSLTNIQPEGGAPGPTGGATQPYAEGGFMLAGTEMWKMVSGVGVSLSHGNRSLLMASPGKHSITAIWTKDATRMSLPQNASGIELFNSQGRRLWSGRLDAATLMRLKTGSAIVIVRYFLE